MRLQRRDSFEYRMVGWVPVLRKGASATSDDLNYNWPATPTNLELAGGIITVTPVPKLRLVQVAVLVSQVLDVQGHESFTAVFIACILTIHPNALHRTGHLYILRSAKRLKGICMVLALHIDIVAIAQRNPCELEIQPAATNQRRITVNDWGQLPSKPY